MILYCHCGHRLHADNCPECDCEGLIGAGETFTPLPGTDPDWRALADEAADVFANYADEGYDFDTARSQWLARWREVRNQGEPT